MNFYASHEYLLDFCSIYLIMLQAPARFLLHLSVILIFLPIKIKSKSPGFIPEYEELKKTLNEMNQHTSRADQRIGSIVDRYKEKELNYLKTLTKRIRNLKKRRDILRQKQTNKAAKEKISLKGIEDLNVHSRVNKTNWKLIQLT